MKYIIEESTSGRYMIKYSINSTSTSLLKPDVELELLYIWETNLMTIIKPDFIKDTFGKEIEDFKKMIGNAVYKSGFPMNTWIRVEIKNIM